MPSYTRNKRRDVTAYVKVTPVLLYGFRTKDLSQVTGVSSGDLTALGHVNTLASGAIACFGANAPKPPRVSKRIANAPAGSQGSVSTFCAYDKLAAALSAGWSLAKDGIDVGLRTSGKSVTAIVEIAPNGVLYAFPMNAADFASYGETLGLESAATLTNAEMQRLVRGSTYPKPGRAIKELDTGGSVSSFYAPANKGNLQQPASGWRVQTNARLLSTPPATP